MTRASIAGVLVLLADTGAGGQRNGGEIRKRADGNGQEYYEVFADAITGEHGGPAPTRIDQGRQLWPTSVVIRAESTWTIDKGSGAPVGPDGTAGGTCQGCPVPTSPPGALVARWVALDLTKLLTLFAAAKTIPLSDWVAIGRSTTLMLPIPSKVSPKPFKPPFKPNLPGLTIGPELEYTPLVALQFQCNDTSFGNNDGWLHIYQDWMW